jgi:hypothetical protein
MPVDNVFGHYHTRNEHDPQPSAPSMVIHSRAHSLTKNRPPVAAPQAHQESSTLTETALARQFFVL